MASKNELLEALERANNEIRALKGEIKTLKEQRTALVNHIGDCEKLNKARDDVYLTLASNITKSLNTKKIVNMTQEESNALYYMLSKFSEISKATDIEAREAQLLHRANLV